MRQVVDVSKTLDGLHAITPNTLQYIFTINYIILIKDVCQTR